VVGPDGEVVGDGEEPAADVPAIVLGRGRLDDVVQLLE
jgi:hypothetical protein